MKRKELFQNVLAYLGSTMDDTETELNYTTPYELLIAVVLSAQCTDKRINAVTPASLPTFPPPKSWPPPRLK